MTEDIQLLNCDVADLLRDLPDGCADFTVGDPPWTYENNGVRGAAQDQYDGLPVGVIAHHVTGALDKARADSYLALWCTFPLLGEWMAVGAGGWLYRTGGCWGKINGLGVGVHFRGDAELLLLYKKGNPKPYRTLSNLWLAPRTDHSEKPQKALRALLELATLPGDLVLDLYAGESASLARACRALGRRYIGAEIDPERHRRAMLRLQQVEMALA